MTTPAPFREPDPVATLQAEVAALRDEVTQLRQSVARLEARPGARQISPDRLPPFVEKGPCRKCGATVAGSKSLVTDAEGKNARWESHPAVAWTYVPPVAARLWRRATIECIRRECRVCKAQYYEAPLDVYAPEQLPAYHTTETSPPGSWKITTIGKPL